jgi:hypothetical protein
MVKKFDATLLSICSTIPVFTGVSAAAEGGSSLVVGTPKSADNFDLVVPIQKEEIVFSPKKAISKPDDLPDLEKIEIGNIRDGKEEVLENKLFLRNVSVGNIQEEKFKDIEVPLKFNRNSSIVSQYQKVNSKQGQSSSQSNISNVNVGVSNLKFEEIQQEKIYSTNELIANTFGNISSIVPPESSNKLKLKSESE